jgi:uncharacterized membrane protein
LSGDLQGVRTTLWPNDHLRFAVTVAQVEKEHPTHVAASIHPSADGHLLPYVVNPKLAASVGPKQRLSPT